MFTTFLGLTLVEVKFDLPSFRDISQYTLPLFHNTRFHFFSFILVQCNCDSLRRNKAVKNCEFNVIVFVHCPGFHESSLQTKKTHHLIRGRCELRVDKLRTWTTHHFSVRFASKAENMKNSCDFVCECKNFASTSCFVLF